MEKRYKNTKVKGKIPYVNLTSSIAFSYFCVGTNFANIWINRRFNRFAKEKSKILKLIRHILTKEKLIKEIYTLNGKNSNFLFPDLIIRTRNNVMPDFRPFPTISFGINEFIHSRYATFLAYGPQTKRHYCTQHIKITDFVPTLLSLLKVPIPKDRHGRVLREIFTKKIEIKPQYISKEKLLLKKKIRRIL